MVAKPRPCCYVPIHYPWLLDDYFERRVKILAIFHSWQTLKEMQRLLVQSACEAFVAADGPKSRSSSNASSTIQWSASSSFRSRSSAGSFRQGSALQHRRSSSLCSIASMKGPGNRAKAAIHRSESIHLARTLSPLLGETLDDPNPHKCDLPHVPSHSTNWRPVVGQKSGFLFSIWFSILLYIILFQYYIYDIL